MDMPAIPFRLSVERQAKRLDDCNSRRGIQCFGFEGDFEAPGKAVVTFKTFNEGGLGGEGAPLRSRLGKYRPAAR